MKATLGQIEKAFGEKLSISSAELTEFIDNRNLIAHNYYRLTRKGITGSKQLQNPEEFLRDFLKQCGYWESVLFGLLNLLMLAASRKVGRENEIQLSKDQLNSIETYHSHVEKRQLD